MDDIIDLADFMRRRELAGETPRTAFAVWGGEGERSRFALPLWRVVYLAGGSRGAIVWTRSGEDRPGRLHPFVVLDLTQDPARTAFSPQLVHGMEAVAAPSLRDRAREGLAVHLGDRDGRRWYLVVDETGQRDEPVGGRARDDILFLSGECAGLLFDRGFGGDVGGPAEE